MTGQLRWRDKLTTSSSEQELVTSYVIVYIIILISTKFCDFWQFSRKLKAKLSFIFSFVNINNYGRKKNSFTEIIEASHIVVHICQRPSLWTFFNCENV